MVALFFDEPESFAMYISDFNIRIHAKVLPQPGYVNIHAAGIKNIIIFPDCGQSNVSRQDGVFVLAK